MSDANLKEINILMRELVAQKPLLALNVAIEIKGLIRASLHGNRENGPNFIHMLTGREKPFHITTATPGRAPDHTRWVCCLCHDKKEIKTRSSDLRVHLKRDHGVPDEQMKEIFNIKNGLALYEHFGPCTEDQAAKNGWSVGCGRPKKEDKKQPTLPKVPPTRSTYWSQNTKSTNSTRSSANSGNHQSNERGANVESDESTLDPRLRGHATMNPRAPDFEPGQTSTLQAPSAQQYAVADPSQALLGGQFTDGAGHYYVDRATFYSPTIEGHYPDAFGILSSDKLGTSPGYGGPKRPFSVPQAQAPANWHENLGIDPQDLHLPRAHEYPSHPSETIWSDSTTQNDNMQSFDLWSSDEWPHH